MRPTKTIAAFVAPSAGSIGFFLLTFAASQSRSATPAPAGEAIWEIITEPSIASMNSPAADRDVSSVLRLNKDALAQQLIRAPMEGTIDLRNSPAVLSLPMPDGSLQRFRIEESPVMEADLATRHPQFRSYRGQGIDDATATTRFDWTPQGLHGVVLSSRDSVYIAPAEQGQTANYLAQFSRSTRGGFKCGVTEADAAKAAARGVYAQNNNPKSPEVVNGPTRRTFRLAVAATGEWTAMYGSGTVGGAQNAIATMVNLIDAIYEKEVAVHFTLVNNTKIIFTNAGTDPYPSPNDADSAALSANQTTLDNNSLLGSANYDIGHLFGVGPGFFSGLASLGVTCDDGFKARGVSTMNGGSITTPQFIAGIAHEIGHQFSATHSFNATTGAFCGSQREATSAYEVGGGSTLMSYQVCEEENLQPIGDQYFYVSSLEQIVNYLTTSTACATTASTGNASPTVTGPGNFNIPKDTPFRLTATGSDSNGPLTYSWEEYDLGTAGPPNTDNGSRPIFRGYPPTSSSTRLFPSLQYILNNANVPPTTYNGDCFDNSGNPIPCLTGESLPNTNRTLHFQVVARDNQATGGAIKTAPSQLTVVTTAGPFAVTAPNGGENWSGARTVTWNVANTAAAPVSCANVRITLSTDGGQTFPIVLATSPPNDGSAGVTLPNGILSSTARIKVEAVGNIFFDISNASFNVSPADTCPAVSNISPKAGNVGNAVTITGINFMNGGNVTGVKFSNNVAAVFNVVDNNTITATVPAGAVGGPITVSKTSCPNVQTGGYTVCPTAPVILKVDDGSLESASSIGDGAFYVNRLTPASYPATLTRISIYWDPFQQFPAGTAINLVVGNNTGGGTNIDGTAFQTVAATAGTQPGFTTYDLPAPIKINAGDFIVGFQVPVAPAGSIPAAVDTNSPQSRSYSSNDGVSFTTVANGNYMIRAAQVFSNCSSPPTPTPTATATATATPKATATATVRPTATATATATAKPTATATPKATPTATPKATPTATPTVAPGFVGNVSTRLPVGTGDNALIEGFIVQGPSGSTKKILVRAIGPSLIPFGITDAVANPTLDIFDASNVKVARNDNWKTTQVGGLITANQFPEISASGLAPGKDPESAIIANLAPGSYTAVVRGAGNTVGTGVVDAYDLSPASAAKLANVATRGLIQPGDKLMIAGFIIQNGPVRVVVRAIGPSLTAFGITNALPNTTLQLRDQNGAIVRQNDDWKTDQKLELESTGLQPTNDLEAALVVTIPPGQYTAQVRGKPESTGIGVVQVYFLQ